MKRTPSAVRPAMFVLIAAALLCTACGDVFGPLLQRADTQHGGDVIESIRVARSGSNYFEERVDSSATFVLHYAEPVAEHSAQENIRLTDEGGAPLPILVDVLLTSIEIVPMGPLESGNHVIRIDEGIEDSSGNGTVQSYEIAFAVP